MAIINQSNILNLQPGITAPVVVHMSEGDSGTKLSFKLIDGARAWTDPGNVVAAVHGRRQDGTQFGPYTCSVIGDVVSFETDAAIAAKAGSGIAQIVLTDSDQNTAGTANFAIMVERATFPTGVTYNNDVSVYEAILACAQSMPAQVSEDFTEKLGIEADARAEADAVLTADVSSLESGLSGEIGNRLQQEALLSARMDSFARLPDGSLSTAADAELADVRVMYDGSTASTAGDAVRQQFSDLKSELRTYESFSPAAKLITVVDLEEGFYSTTNGKKTDNTETSTYRRAKCIVPVVEKMLYASGNIDVRAACFTGEGNYIGWMWIYADESTEKRKVTPEGTAFLGLYAKDATAFILRKIDCSNFVGVEYPFDGDDYIYKPGYWCNANGGIYASANLGLLIFGGITPGDKYYVSNNAGANCLCFDINGTLLTTQSESRNVQGKIFTIPEGAVVACFNIYANRKTGVNNDLVDYVVRLNGKKILAIGDSITWLDGRQNYGGAAYVSGWQRKLRLLGYDVVNAGWSGNPYATGLNVTADVDNSIYARIVTDGYDVTGYDYVIMFGGANDILLHAPLGTRTSVYAERNFDSGTFNGAISGIISYVRTNNPTCKILLASFPKSEAATRIYANASQYLDEILYNATFWSCKYVNIFDDMNVQPTYPGFSEYFYDVTHPNFNGMVVIGQLMKKALEQYEQ